MSEYPERAPDARQSSPVPLPMDRECPFDPPRALEELRNTQPLSRVELPDGEVGWLVTSYELARAVMGDQRFSRVPSGPPTFPRGRQAAVVFDAMQRDLTFPGEVRALVDRYREEGRLAEAFRDPKVVLAIHEQPLTTMPFSNSDPPGHTRVRRMLTGYYSVRRVAEQRTNVERVVADCLEAMERVGPPVDLVEMFARRIPSLMICVLFGLPESEKDRFEQLVAADDDITVTPDDLREIEREFRAYSLELIERKRAQPGDDLLSALVQAGELTDVELVTMVGFLVGSSLSSTATSIAYAMATLLSERDHWDALRTDSAAIGRIVEELLRYTTTVHMPPVRTALEDVELGGTVIKAFEIVAISLAAANRDPQIFTEPDRLDLTRQEAAKHLTFGFGIHQCLGQHLVRLELQIGLAALAERFPTLDLAGPVDEIVWRDGADPVYAPERLLVTW